MWKQKIPVTKCYPQWVLNHWTSDSKSNMLLSTLTWQLLLRRSLNFCSCTTWCLDLDDLVRINKAWLYKELKVSVLQANAKLVQRGACWTWNQRSSGSILTGVAFCNWIFLFSRNKASDANYWHYCAFRKNSISYDNKSQHMMNGPSVIRKNLSARWCAWLRGGGWNSSSLVL